MSRSIFGWSLPPGCTQRHIDEAYGGDESPCKCCGLSDCICPECPQCSEVGNPYCYEQGYLEYSTRQLLGRARLRLAELEAQIDDEKMAISSLEITLDEEENRE